MTHGVDPSALDRRPADRGRPDVLAEHWREGRLLVVAPDASMVLDPFGSPTTGDHDPTRHVFLGRWRDQWWFAQRGQVARGASLRAGEQLDGDAHELVATAIALLGWHDHGPRCERCHGETSMTEGGATRTCLSCGAQLFPRTDPAMIVAVLDADDRLLLAHQAAWPEARVSILAGFVEAGESAEQCVVREVFEESGLRVTDLAFVRSRPWPFPRSLMLGFVARAEGEIAVDGTEIAWARWFTREELARAEADAAIALPSGALAVSTQLIAEWRAGTLGQRLG